MPIQNFPNEILSEIFVHCLPRPYRLGEEYEDFEGDMLEPNDDEPVVDVVKDKTRRRPYFRTFLETRGCDIRPHRPGRIQYPELIPLILRRVCKRWKEIVEKTPQLFQTLMLTKNFLNPYIAIQWLHWSRNLPMIVILVPEYWNVRDAERTLILTLIARHMPRIRYLGITMSPYLRILLPEGSKTVAPMLQHFQILYSCFHTEILESLDDAGDATFGELVSDNLRFLFLKDLCMGSPTVVFGTQSLVHFQDTGSYHDPKDIFHLLSTCVNLQSFSVACEEDHTSSLEPPPNEIVLPYLTSFFMELICGETDFPLLSRIIERLRTPSLKDFEVHPKNTVNIDESLLFNAIASWFSSCQPSLETFKMNDLTVDEELFRTVVATGSSMYLLRLSDQIGEGILDALRNPHALPRLTNLQFSWAQFHTPIDVVLEVIRGRLPVAEPPGCLQYIRLTRCTDAEGHEIAEELKEKIALIVETCPGLNIKVY